MDVPREKQPSRRSWWVAGISGLAVLAVLGLSRLKPAAPVVEKQSVLIDAVKRGPLEFQVRGTGTLQPLEVRWITNAVASRVEHVIVFPGTPVKADTVLMELSNAELQQSAQDAEWQLKAAEAELIAARARLEQQLLDVKATLATARANNANARMSLEANERLAKEGLIASQDLAKSRVQSEELGTRFEVEQRRYQIGSESLKAQLATYQAKVEQARALHQLKRSQVDNLRVRAGMDGVLQQLPVQVGQQLSAGTTLAKVAQPARLKAELKVSESLAKDLLLGQRVSVDTRNGLVEGKLIRIDPAVQNGTVTVDVAIVGELPKSARPDQNVEGIIEIDRAADILSVGRPVQAQARSKAGLFKLSEDGSEAYRANVSFGRASVSNIEVIEGLKVGDRVILSDISAWDGVDRIKLK
jgi:HlyD family secretion protein